jgi:exodeoxyribonuclease VII small subunit
MKKTQTFEQAMNRLEEISQALESGEISLEQSIKLLDEGNKLVEFCQSKLNEAEKKIQKLSRNADGTFMISPLNNLPQSDND